jgi:hypothetical protein
MNRLEEKITWRIIERAQGVTKKHLSKGAAISNQSITIPNHKGGSEVLNEDLVPLEQKPFRWLLLICTFPIQEGAEGGSQIAILFSQSG